MTDSLSILLAGIVDYAGLFPPSTLDMASAVDAYADYLRDPAKQMLGRFVLPVARLREFEEISRDLLPRGEDSTPWVLSALTGPDVHADIDQVLKFNCRHWSSSELGHVTIDVLEIKASSAAEIGAAMSRMPQQLHPFFEIPSQPDPAELIAEIKRSGGQAKIRTGGVTVDAFPLTAEVLRFIECCREQRVAFKATAGLHHPIRAEYRLTYDDRPPMGMMYGYLNLFVAAAFAWAGAGRSLMHAALDETDIDTFLFDDTGLTYRGHTLTLAKLRDARQSFVLSFGSCSFREPVDEITALFSLP